MKALLLREYRKLEVTQMPEPACGPDDVLVRVKACGICGSDVHGFDGSTGRRIPPIVMGHEAAGVVAAVGANVERWRAGERITFTRRMDADGRERLEGENVVKPGNGPPMHAHLLQEEVLTVRTGRLAYQRPGQEPRFAGPGETVAFPPGDGHKFWNAGDDVLHFVCVVKPALRFEQLLETMFALATDGKTNRKGMPNPLRLAVIARATFDTVRLPLVPTWMQRTALALGAPAGRLLGYEATYTPAGGIPSLA